MNNTTIVQSKLTRLQHVAHKKRHKTAKLPADKGGVTVVMDKDYTDKICSLVNDKQTYESRKRDPTPALQRRLNSKLLELKKTKAIDIQLYYRVRCRVLQSA